MADIARAPLYVNRSPKKWAAVDLAPNIAVRVVAAIVLIPAATDPTFYRKRVQQPDILPNVAALAQRPTPRYAPEPVFYRRNNAGVDVLPNIAVRVATSTYLPPPYVEDHPTRGRFAVVDLYPNLAVRLQTIQPGLGQSCDQTYHRPLQQILDYPNISVRVVAPQFPAPPLVEPAIKRKRTLYDLSPNLAAKSAAEVPRVPAMIQPQLFVHRAPQMDIYPNLAIRYTPPVGGTQIVTINLGLSLSRLGGRVWG